MRSEREVFELLENIFKEDDKIRVAMLEGSRTNKNIPKDKYQDYDLSFFVESIDHYTKDDSWLKRFGDIIFLQKPEEMSLFPPDFENWYSYLMYFSDGIRIDLTLIPLKELDNYLDSSDGLIEILIDKDNRIKREPISTDKKYWLKKPTAQEFDDCCNEFWHISTYVVKGLKRQELLFALDYFNDVLRPELLRMISWDIGLKEGFDFSLGKNYKFIERYLSEQAFNELLKTYSVGGKDELLEAFEICCELFRTYTKQVATVLDYEYPTYDEKITAFIKKFYLN